MDRDGVQHGPSFWTYNHITTCCARGAMDRDSWQSARHSLSSTGDRFVSRPQFVGFTSGIMPGCWTTRFGTQFGERSSSHAGIRPGHRRFPRLELTSLAAAIHHDPGNINGATRHWIAHYQWATISIPTLTLPASLIVGDFTRRADSFDGSSGLRFPGLILSASQPIRSLSFCIDPIRRRPDFLASNSSDALHCLYSVGTLRGLRGILLARASASANGLKQRGGSARDSLLGDRWDQSLRRPRTRYKGPLLEVLHLTTINQRRQPPEREFILEAGNHGALIMLSSTLTDCAKTPPEKHASSVDLQAGTFAGLISSEALRLCPTEYGGQVRAESSCNASKAYVDAGGRAVGGSWAVVRTETIKL